VTCSREVLHRGQESFLRTRPWGSANLQGTRGAAKGDGYCVVARRPRVRTKEARRVKGGFRILNFLAEFEFCWEQRQGITL